MAKNKRFVEVYSEGNEFSTVYKVIVDKETGVNYIMTKSGYAGGMTVLLDAEGKPVITPISEI